VVEATRNADNKISRIKPRVPGVVKKKSTKGSGVPGQRPRGRKRLGTFPGQDLAQAVLTTVKGRKRVKGGEATHRKKSAYRRMRMPQPKRRHKNKKILQESSGP